MKITLNTAIADTFAREIRGNILLQGMNIVLLGDPEPGDKPLAAVLRAVADRIDPAQAQPPLELAAERIRKAASGRWNEWRDTGEWGEADLDTIWIDVDNRFTAEEGWVSRYGTGLYFPTRSTHGANRHFGRDQRGALPTTLEELVSRATAQLAELPRHPPAAWVHGELLALWGEIDQNPAAAPTIPAGADPIETTRDLVRLIETTYGDMSEHPSMVAAAALLEHAEPAPDNGGSDALAGEG